MKVLWIINNMLPEMYAHISGSVYDKVSSSNSWTTALLEASKGKLDLSIAMFYSGKSLIDKTFDGIRCFAIPRRKNPFKYEKQLNVYLSEIDRCIDPDVVHVHGTEYPHSYNAVEVFGTQRVVVSIQGLISVIARYYMSGISKWDVFKNLTIRNIVFRDSIIGQKRIFTERGEWEIKTIQKAKYIVGRTEWDKIHSHTINPTIEYHHVDELMRKEFFDSAKWSYEKCTKHTIFISQSSYPIKGLHMMLRALNIVKRTYPDVKLRIAGKPFLNHDTIREYLAYSGYARYLNKLISNMQLQDNVEFAGFKDAHGMVEEYLNANVYVCPSCIENSPNSMCEAQMLGVPSVLSICGGVYDMTDFGQTALLYRFEEYEMLAHYIMQIFASHQTVQDRIDKGIRLAHKRHNKALIVESLLNLYKTVAHD